LILKSNLCKFTLIIEKRFEHALATSDPVEALRSLVLELSTEGFAKAAILEIFEQQRQRLRTANRESAEEAVMDVMDFLVGWCSPHMKLLADESESSNQDIQMKLAPIQEAVL